MKAMKTTWFVAAAAVAGIGFIALPVARSQQGAAKQASPLDAHRAMINAYCVGCHNAKLKTANLVLEGLSLEKIAENAAVWEKVVRKLNGGQMPPQGVPKPPAAQTSG